MFHHTSLSHLSFEPLHHHLCTKNDQALGVDDRHYDEDHPHLPQRQSVPLQLAVIPDPLPEPFRQQLLLDPPFPEVSEW